MPELARDPEIFGDTYTIYGGIYSICISKHLWISGINMYSYSCLYIIRKPTWFTGSTNRPTEQRWFSKGIYSEIDQISKTQLYREE